MHVPSLFTSGVGAHLPGTVLGAGSALFFAVGAVV
jgi:hypothetical protein